MVASYNNLYVQLLNEFLTVYTHLVWHAISSSSHSACVTITCAYEIGSSGQGKLPCAIVVGGQEVGDSAPDLQSLYLHV